MKQIASDVLGLIKSINPIDLLLYFAVLVLIVLIVSLAYIIKTGDEEEETDLKNNDSVEDLKTIVQNLEIEKPSVLKLTDYEAEQEEKAIISYEELVAKNKLGNVSFSEEKIKDDEITIKKINLDTLIENKSQEIKPICFYNYEREEAFLKKLKALNHLLS